MKEDVKPLWSEFSGEGIPEIVGYTVWARIRITFGGVDLDHRQIVAVGVMGTVIQRPAWQTKRLQAMGCFIEEFHERGVALLIEG